LLWYFAIVPSVFDAVGCYCIMPGHAQMEMSKKKINSELIGEYISVISTLKGISFFVCFSVSMRNLRKIPAGFRADCRETLPHARYLRRFYNASPKLRGIHFKNLGPKTCKIWCDYTQLPTLLAIISGTRQDIQNRNGMSSRTIPPAFGERSSVNFGPLVHYPESRTCEFGPTQIDFFGKLYFGP